MIEKANSRQLWLSAIACLLVIAVVWLMWEPRIDVPVAASQSRIDRSVGPDSFVVEPAFVDREISVPEVHPAEVVLGNWKVEVALPEDAPMAVQRLVERIEYQYSVLADNGMLRQVVSHQGRPGPAKDYTVTKRADGNLEARDASGAVITWRPQSDGSISLIEEVGSEAIRLLPVVREESRLGRSEQD